MIRERTIYIGDEWKYLPDTAEWEYRFQCWDERLKSNVTIKQHRSGRGWACSCKEWRTTPLSASECTHLEALGIPANEPCEVFIVGPHSSKAGLRRQINRALARHKEYHEAQRILQALKAADLETMHVEVADLIEHLDECAQPVFDVAQLILDEDDV